MPPATPSPHYVYVAPTPLWIVRPVPIVVVFTATTYWSRPSCSSRLCQRDYAACRRLYNYDDCVCVPGLLHCMERQCRTDYIWGVTECQRSVNPRALCHLSCAPMVHGDYSVTNYSVLVGLSVQGISASNWAAYEVNVPELLEEAQATNGSVPWPVTIHTAPHDAGSDSRTELVAEIHTTGPSSMLSVQAFFLNASATEWLATTLFEYGVLFNTSQLAITSVQTFVIPLFNDTVATTTMDFDPTIQPPTTSSATNSGLGFVLGSLLGLGMFGLAYLCQRRQRRPSIAYANIEIR
ncbi:hypothetical protein SPRG_12720 [Saprolegnia parasitica CBS 223.65]|uniref:Uncharacterized protein n=1 Tax=Saprolegnia parasitica (strain CBS 223.65) TaxID=695850 RepID=A0A067BV70_SAPPC|nr:hypothetical protein SPRG_12720 [Saprolegnia parasitica CBS 223.65]KDO22439.1 hypothetical protein SPRG_12720 [Saprolegnia parasitica CBS 223.65]|eukprot:XP_012206827.1 hypothetical protein SPRG_12720 [Saprolegnia parasitica CBS 223.65]